MTNTKKKGTSLVELLAVIVIMGIIAAIAVPTVGALLKNTRQKAAVSDITTVVQSVDSYLSGANQAEKDALGITDDHKLTITFGLDTYAETDTTADGKKIYAIFDTEQDTTKNIKGAITFVLNDSETKVTSLEFASGTTYNKNGKGYTFSNGAVDTIKAKEGDAATK